MTVVSRNPVHSVLWLILRSCLRRGCSCLGAEFVAMLLIIVYVGAVAVLFLFVVMMLDVDFAELKAEMSKYMPLALLIGVVILMSNLALPSAHGALLRWRKRAVCCAAEGHAKHSGAWAADLRQIHFLFQLRV